MKQLLKYVLVAVMIVAVCGGAYRSYNSDSLDREEAVAIARDYWVVKGLNMGREFFTAYPIIEVKLACYELGHQRAVKTLHVPTDHLESWMYKTLKLDDTVRFNANDGVIFPRTTKWDAAREGIGCQRFLKLVEFPWRTAKEESEREGLESGPYRHLINIVDRIKEADAKNNIGDLQYGLWNYAYTLRQWRGEALVTEPAYLLPVKFWNKRLDYRGNEYDLDSGRQSSPTGQVFFRVAQKKGKSSLLAIELR